MKKFRQPRGLSLIEVMMASAVLIIGLTGITAMLVQGIANTRAGQQTILSANYATQSMDEVLAGGFKSLVPSVGQSFSAGTAVDGGYYVDGSGRPYHTAYIVTDIGGTWPTYRVDLQTEYTDGLGNKRYVTESTFLSKAPDGG